MKLKSKLMIAAISAGLMLILSCGIKGPPLPPIETIEDKAYIDPSLAKEGVAPTPQPESTDKTGVKKNK